MWPRYWAVLKADRWINIGTTDQTSGERSRQSGKPNRLNLQRYEHALRTILKKEVRPSITRREWTAKNKRKWDAASSKLTLLAEQWGCSVILTKRRRSFRYPCLKPLSYNIVCWRMKEFQCPLFWPRVQCSVVIAAKSLLTGAKTAGWGRGTAIVVVTWFSKVNCFR